MWFSYIIDKNRKNEPLDKGVITISFIVDITLLILSILLLIDSTFDIDFGPAEIFNKLL